MATDAVRIVRRRFLVVQLDEPAADADFGRRLEELKKFLAAGPLQPGDEDAALRAAEIAERRGNERLAAETYESMAKLLAAEPKFALKVRQMEAIARGLKLVGNTMRLEGKTLGGKDLEWARYRGKVVLIDFWFSGYAPCLEEIADIKVNYEKYRSQGFEVIGISRDRISSLELAAFVKAKGIPWTICRDADSSQPIAAYYGLRSISQGILVGRDGKVIALNVLGPDLGPQVEKALAAPVSTAPGADDEEAAKLKQETERKKADEAAAQEKREQAAKAQARQVRTWTDASGKFRVTAKFRGMVNQVVKLEREDGTVISVPLEKLSDADQECIRQRKY